MAIRSQVDRRPAKTLLAHGLVAGSAETGAGPLVIMAGEPAVPHATLLTIDTRVGAAIAVEIARRRYIARSTQREDRSQVILGR